MRAFLRTCILPYLYETHFIQGSSSRLRLGRKVATSNALFNTSSGRIKIGDYTIFSSNCAVITGRHLFDATGQRAGLKHVQTSDSWGGGEHEVPEQGYDITIGSGCWIGVGAIILGGVDIGDNSIVGAGAVVTKSFPTHSILGGVPAKSIGSTLPDKHN